MTRVQRRRHLAMWCIIGPAALVLIVVALAVRPSAGTLQRTQPAASAGEARGGRP